VAAYLRKLAPGASLPQDAAFALEEREGGALLVKQLFTHGRAKLTTAIWIMYFMVLLDLNFLYSWLPTIMHDAGIVVERAILITTSFQIGGTIGAMLIGRVFDRRSSFKALGWTYLGATVFVFAISLAGVNTGLLVATIFAAGFFVVGGQNASHAFCAAVYPTSIRSTGVGWALGIGRVGSFMGPLVGGALLVSQGQAHKVFWAASVAALIATCAAFFAARETARHDIAEARASEATAS
jgi:AAHS family 4-hydroxybenzoate transporter-like MFS transporter